jgi:uncharacterized protein
MITFLVSSKTMFKKDVGLKLSVSEPKFLQEAKVLNAELLKLNVEDLQKLMHISENLAKEVRAKIETWGDAKTEAWPAWLYFSGDVYRGLSAETLDTGDLEWAQNKLWTLSGLYGIARPLDLIKPYRLEAAFKLKVDGKDNLYDFWGDKIVQEISEEVVVNLSSEEYIKLIRKHYRGKIITPLFLQDRESGVKFEAVHAKVARGMMARWIIKNRIDDPLKLKEFAEDGYFFDKERSSELETVFIRRAEGVMKIVRP